MPSLGVGGKVDLCAQAPGAPLGLGGVRKPCARKQGIHRPCSPVIPSVPLHSSGFEVDTEMLTAMFATVLDQASRLLKSRSLSVFFCCALKF